MSGRGQRFIVDLSPNLARRALDLVGRQRPYEDLNELIVVALENQLRLESDSVQLAPDPTREAAHVEEIRAQSDDALARETSYSSLTDISLNRLLQSPGSAGVETGPGTPGSGRLSQFTNRLSPFLVPVRVLCSAQILVGPPALDDFIQVSSTAARSVGLRLRKEDERHRRRGRDRRWTGWPVGDDEVTSVARYRRSFLLVTEDERPIGPLVDLGLLAMIDGHVLPTDRALGLAKEKSATFGESQEMLTEVQRELFREALYELAGEREEIRLFLSIVRQADGLQSSVDGKLRTAHPNWSEAQVVAHRAAMLGRLRDAGLLDVVSKAGQEVEIYVEPDGAIFEERLDAGRH